MFSVPLGRSGLVFCLVTVWFCSCLVLSCLVLSCLVWSGLVWSGLVLSWSGLVPCHTAMHTNSFESFVRQKLVQLLIHQMGAAMRVMSWIVIHIGEINLPMFCEVGLFFDSSSLPNGPRQRRRHESFVWSISIAHTFIARSVNF